MNMYTGAGRILFTLMIFAGWALALYVPIVLIGASPSGAQFKLWLVWSIAATSFGLRVLQAMWLEP